MKPEENNSLYQVATLADRNDCFRCPKAEPFGPFVEACAAGKYESGATVRTENDRESGRGEGGNR